MKNFDKEHKQKLIDKKNIEANRFAMELLLPTPFIEREYRKLEKTMDPLEIPKVIAEIFKMPEGLVGAKLVQMKIGFYGQL